MAHRIREEDMNLHDYLETMSPDCPIKVFNENEENRVVFDGYCGEATENRYFVNWKLTGHAFRNGEMLIWAI